MTGEICEKCGREIPNHQQAYVVGGKIVCAECDKLLRSEQVPQPASSPEPCPEIRKGTEKNASLRNRILVAIGIVIIAVVLWNMYFSGSKYQVETKIVRKKDWASNDLSKASVMLRVKITTTGNPESLAVVFFGPSGDTSIQDIESRALMDYEATVEFLLSSWGYQYGYGYSVDPKPGSYTLMIRKERNGKIIFKKKIDITSDMIEHAEIVESNG